MSLQLLKEETGKNKDDEKRKKVKGHDKGNAPVSVIEPISKSWGINDGHLHLAIIQINF